MGLRRLIQRDQDSPATLKTIFLEVERGERDNVENLTEKFFIVGMHVIQLRCPTRSLPLQFTTSSKRHI